MNTRLILLSLLVLLTTMTSDFERKEAMAASSDCEQKKANATTSDCERKKTIDPKPPAVPPPMEVEMVPAIAKTISLQQQIPGRLQAVRSAQIRARVEGIVEKLLFVEGTEVAAGTPLYRLDARTLTTSVKSAQAALDRAVAERQLAKQTMDRLKTLVQTDAVSRQDFDGAEAQFKKTSAQVSIEEAALTKTRIDLEYATITAPIAGRAGRSLVTEGALVGHKEATHLTTVEQIDPIWVNFTQSSPELFRLRRAIRTGRAQPIEPVEVRLLLEDDVEYLLPGKLHFTDMAVDPQTGSVALRAEFPNPDRILLPGQFVRVQLALATTKGITIPQRAVQPSPQGQIVMMVDEHSKVVVRPIKTGGFSGQDWIVTEGLEAGEKVIINGVQKVRPGLVVTPKDLGASSPPPAGPTPATAP